MNLEAYKLGLMDIEGFQLKEVLRCLLHTIIFQRALGTIVPKEIDCDVFDVSYARVDDAQIERAVERRIDHMYQAIVGTKTTQFTVTLRFYVNSETEGFMMKANKRQYWEDWVIPISIATQKITSAAERDRRHSKRQQTLRERLMYIIQMVNAKNKHIPPVKKYVPCFPFEINFSDGTKPPKENWSLGKMFSQYISQGLSKREA